MPISEMKKVIEGKNIEQQVALMLALHGAPILKGIKLANLLTVSKDEVSVLIQMLEGTGISYRLVLLKNNRVMVYLFRQDKLQQYLSVPQVQSFLKEYGYGNLPLKEMLELLMIRIMHYKEGIEEFPHEIGIFLGYPLEDVLGFLQNNGEKFSYVGYWKVYYNVQEKMKLFHCYDRERDVVIREVLSGKKIREIAV
ncbi:MAG: DUF3793 family protein [Eubacterium sp.]|nr:DUF3793 family protein [Eubacterium sp.]